MGSSGGKIGVLVAAAVAIVALFVLLSGGEESPTTTLAEPAIEQKQADSGKQKPEPEPDVPVIAVEGGAPVGGVQALEFTSGSTIEFTVTSDADAVFHLHGYDVEQPVSAGGETTFELAAEIEGVFELEDHETAEPIAEITVSPA